MAYDFFSQPILNSPYELPAKHWELDETGQPTQKLVETRRAPDFISPIPQAKRQKGALQKNLAFDEGHGISTENQQYDRTATIALVRKLVGAWREIKDPAKWGVTAETARLLDHWRNHEFSGIRPFFCQVEAVETAIWLTEVASSTKEGKEIRDRLKQVNEDANPELFRIALKLATGAGKTTVMAMLIAWQTINAVRHPGSQRFTRGFLVVAPGITIKDRLRVLMPNDPDSYYASRELVPADLVDELYSAKIVITNYHAFKRRDLLEISRVGRALLQGRGEDVESLETDGQMLQRVMPELMSMKNVMVINDEAHHCYREKPKSTGEEDEEGLEHLKGEDKREAKEEVKKNREAARIWISGLEAVNRKIGISRVMDLSATPFFLRGSNYVEGTLFHWTMSDFSLMDAIECGIVKLPRVPVADNIPGGDMPKYRELWENIRAKMPKKRRSHDSPLDPLSIPVELQTALAALYKHYDETFELWKREEISVPPCFIIVCNNTSTSKLVYDYVSGFLQDTPDGPKPYPGKFELFRNTNEHGDPLGRPRTLLIDSAQLESGESLDDNFRSIAGEEIERFRREVVERTGDRSQAENLTDQDLLREVMNTVGKQGRLGDSIRCVVSVSMLTEGWDANTVTHILGVRAFGTQLLCEQVVGRALRRQSYDLNEDGLFNVEYADVLGVPFNFNAKPVISKPVPPRETIQVKAVRPDRDALEITFPRVQGYRVELPEERLEANFTEDSKLILTPEMVGPTRTQNEGIVGEGVMLDAGPTGNERFSTVVYKLTERLLYTKWRDPDEAPKFSLFGQLKRITHRWLEECLECKGGTYPGQLLYQELTDMACSRITNAITLAHLDSRPVKAILDPFNPTGSTMHVNFNTSKKTRWSTRKSHVNWVITDSDWESEFCRIVENHRRVKSYVKNHSLGFEAPYVYGSESRKYRPDFIVRIDDGHGEDDLFNLIAEVKGFRKEDAKEKKAAMETYWVPGVNNLGTYGRWSFVEFTEVWSMEEDFETLVEELSRVPSDNAARGVLT